jgi:NADH dehydrogenase FAD-containing subunit
MGIKGHPGVWALGDCAMIPDEQGGYQPPTAQHASREGKVLAHNIVASVRGDALRPFRFKTLGLLASIGRRTDSFLKILIRGLILLIALIINVHAQRLRASRSPVANA